MHKLSTCWMAIASCLLLASSLAAEEGLPVAELQREEPVSFQREILPFLRQSCLACHNQQDAESSLVLETAEKILQGGDSGPAVAPGNVGDSLIFQFASHRTEPIMPPADNAPGAKNLTPDQLGLLKLWIEQGAKADSGDPVEKIHFHPVPDRYAPVYAVAISAHGQLVAAGRGNRIDIYDSISKRRVARLVDPELTAVEGYANAQAAHLDVVQSLAFAPNEQWLASGGFRNVKLWQPTPAEFVPLVQLDRSPTQIAVSPDGVQLAIVVDSDPESGHRSRILIVDAKSGHTLHSLDPTADAALRAATFLRDGQHLAGRSAAGQLQIWNLDDGSSRTQPLDAALADIHDLSSVGLLGIVLVDGRVGVVQLSELASPAGEPVADLPAAADSAASARYFVGDSGAARQIVGTVAGDQLVTIGGDQLVRLWNVGSGEVARTFDVGSPPIQAVLTAGGRRLLTLHEDGAARLWNIEDGKSVGELPRRHRYEVSLADARQAVERQKQKQQGGQADLDRAKKRLEDEQNNVKKSTEEVAKAEEGLKAKAEELAKATAAKDEAEKLVAMAKEEVAAEEAALKAAVDQLAATSSEAATVEPGTAGMADKENEKAEAKEAPPVDRAVLEASKSEAEARLNAAREKLKQAEESLKQKTEPAMKAEKEHEAAVKALEIARLAVERAGEVAKIANDEMVQVERLLEQLTADVGAAEKVAADRDQQWQQRMTRLTHIQSLRDGWRAAACDDQGLLHIYDAESGQVLDEYSLPNSQATAVGLAAGKGDQIFVALADGQIYGTALERGWQLVHRIGSPDSTAAFADRVTSLAFSPDSAVLATGSGEPSRSGQLKLWNVSDGTFLREIPEAHSDVLFDLDFSPDGKLLATCGADRLMKVFRVEDGSLVRTFEGHTGQVLGVSWKGDGRLLATAGADNSLKVWEADTGSQKKTISGFKKEITSVRYVGIDDRLVFGTGEGKVESRNSNGDGRPGFAGDSDYVHSVRASGDGNVIVGGDQNGTVRIWKADGTVVAEFPREQ